MHKKFTLEELNNINDSKEKKFMLMSFINSNHRNKMVNNLVKSKEDECYLPKDVDLNDSNSSFSSSNISIDSVIQDVNINLE